MGGERRSRSHHSSVRAQFSRWNQSAHGYVCRWFLGSRWQLLLCKVSWLLCSEAPPALHSLPFSWHSSAQRRAVGSTLGCLVQPEAGLACWGGGSRENCVHDQETRRLWSRPVDVPVGWTVAAGAPNLFLSLCCRMPAVDCEGLRCSMR